MFLYGKAPEVIEIVDLVCMRQEIVDVKQAIESGCPCWTGNPKHIRTTANVKITTYSGRMRSARRSMNAECRYDQLPMFGNQE